MYEPTEESLKGHEAPEWYHDAKFGIFIHWGLFSVPAFAPPSQKDLFAMQDDIGFDSIKQSPYAEWYLNSMKFKDFPTWKYHAETFGEDFPYDNFQAMFETESSSMNPENWANLFFEAGAKYVVMVTKHHDGYMLWPSSHPNPLKPDFHSKRDLVGETTKAVKAKGLKMGFYYSGVFDWSFIKQPIGDGFSFVLNYGQTKEYTEYAKNHFVELIDRYEPSILWNDIGAPFELDVRELQAYFYNKIKDGVTNDRWLQLKVPTEQGELDELKKALAGGQDQMGLAFAKLLKEPFHRDFSTPEYKTYKEKRDYKWESTRGIGHSFGYNKVETEKDMLTSKEMIHMLVDVVSKNGNLLLNVGPKPDGSIPDMQVKPLKALGAWLKDNGEAIYGTRPWDRAEGNTTAGQEVRFTAKQDSLYATILDEIGAGELTIQDLKVQDRARISMLGDNQPLKWNQSDGNLRIEIPQAKSAVASSFKITPLPDNLAN